MSEGSRSHVAVYEPDRLLVPGDAMLLSVFVGPAIAGALVMLTASAGLGGYGAILGGLVAPAIGAALAWLLHRRPFGGRVVVGIAVGLLCAAVGMGAVYALVIATEFDQSSKFWIPLAVVLSLEALVMLPLIADAIGDLARLREHLALDIVRIVAALSVVALVLLFLLSDNPDAGIGLVVLAPLAAAGFVVGWLTDVIGWPRNAESHGGEGVSTPLA